ncbi:MAG TPA: M48 family peptidase [Gammaproteobacteria bacterium]|nr:M48 family peptidase [Gammaproteobacteria bacterium]HIL97591.1 M48 family peptidase [Pseudomonadales bacterium]
MQPAKQIVTQTVLGICLIVASHLSMAVDSNNLPSLGDYTSGIVSLEQERAIGQEFLRSLRAGAPLVYDPVLQEYLELLIYKLASHSQLKDRRLDLVIINNESLNAFAAPGGIVGVNLGLFLFGESESEISAILAHEIAHLSQRHFARRSEAGKKASLTSMVGLLTGVVLMATSNSEAGMAAISASRAITQSEMLRYSRSREAEADRVGINTLLEAELDPRAMAHMFERLNRASRFDGRDIPEFLLTHPVTKNRIADSYAHTEKQPLKVFDESLDFHLMRARILTMIAESNVDTILRMTDKLTTGDEVTQTAARYGLALAQNGAGQFDNSMRNIMRLRAEYPSKIAFILAEADIHVSAERYENALAVLEQALLIAPGNYPLTMAHAETLMKAKQADAAVAILLMMTQTRANDQDVWFLLAEAYGLARNGAGVHQARAEYFILVGNFDQALKQLGFATPLVRGNFQENARIQQRINEIYEMLARRNS